MKRLVVCCDGTWNRSDQQKDGVACPTNVHRFAVRVAKQDANGVPQITSYHHGVGTGNIIDKYSGGAIGSGLDEKIFNVYRFLIANYEVGDELYFVGFSRGAFIARSAAGMIRNCGILARRSVGQYRAALDLYRDNIRKPDHAEAIDFRGKHSIAGEGEIPIKFVGVWDTVGALGIPLRGFRWMTQRRYQFHDTELSRTVENAFHALAIDERRTPFEPTLWTYVAKPGQIVNQTWFCGVHSDVGGGYIETGLSDIPLQWMLEKAASVGLEIDDAALACYPTCNDPKSTLHNSKRGLYRVTRGRRRSIPTDPTQQVHSTVLERWDADPTYRPLTLQRYLRRIGDSRGN